MTLALLTSLLSWVLLSPLQISPRARVQCCCVCTALEPHQRWAGDHIPGEPPRPLLPGAASSGRANSLSTGPSGCGLIRVPQVGANPDACHFLRPGPISLKDPPHLIHPEPPMGDPMEPVFISLFLGHTRQHLGVTPGITPGRFSGPYGMQG